MQILHRLANADEAVLAQAALHAAHAAATRRRPCRHAGDCALLPVQFHGVQGAPDSYACHAFPDSAYKSDTVIVGLVAVAARRPSGRRGPCRQPATRFSPSARVCSVPVARLAIIIMWRTEGVMILRASGAHQARLPCEEDPPTGIGTDLTRRHRCAPSLRCIAVVPVLRRCYPQAPHPSCGASSAAAASARLPSRGGDAGGHPRQHPACRSF